jgi:hypothetical protein
MSSNFNSLRSFNSFNSFGAKTCAPLPVEKDHLLAGPSAVVGGGDPPVAAVSTTTGENPKYPRPPPLVPTGLAAKGVEAVEPDEEEVVGDEEKVGGR